MKKDEEERIRNLEAELPLERPELEKKDENVEDGENTQLLLARLQAPVKEEQMDDSDEDDDTFKGKAWYRNF